MARNKVARLHCEETECYTPERVVLAVHELFPRFLDPATHISNPTKARLFHTKDDDGCCQDWSASHLPVFVNPPYGEVFEAWTYKVHEQAEKHVQIAALYPCGARFSTAYYQAHVLNRYLTCICFFNKRLDFHYLDGRPVGPSNIYDSQLCCFNVQPFEVYKAFGHLGKVVSTVVYP